MKTGYTAREFAMETNLYYYRARYYDPTSGRFLSEDPIRTEHNFYVYVGNNSTDLSDPLGLEKNKSCLLACGLDATLNFSLGFVPGYNALKLGLSIVHISINPFQAAGGFAPVVEAPGPSGVAAGIASGFDAYQSASYSFAGGDRAVLRAADLLGRNSFDLKTAAQQEKLLQNFSRLNSLRKVASAAGTIANILNAIDYGITLKHCWDKCETCR
jgi:RHS repeat-associated protein